MVADESNNALIITASAQEYGRMRRILEQIDVQPNQVLIEATIAEVALNDQLSMGLRWFLQAGNFQFRFTDILATTPTTPTANVAATIPTIATPAFPGFRASSTPPTSRSYSMR